MKSSNNLLAKALWKDLPGEIIENEEYKESQAEKEAKKASLNKRAMGRKAKTVAIGENGKIAENGDEEDNSVSDGEDI